MNLRSFSKFAWAATAAALLFGCSLLLGCTNAEVPKPQLASPPDPVKPNIGSQLEGSHLADSQVPFVLTLVTPKNMPESGQFELSAKIVSAKGWSTPTTISISLPATAKLLDGQKREVLVDLPSGTTTRTFKIGLTGKLDARKPIKVSVDMRDPKGAFGAHAARQYPKAPVTVSGNPNVPKPPVGRPGKGISARSVDPGPRTAPGTRKK